MVTAYVDNASGTITLQADRFFLSAAEQRDVVSAHGVAMIDCIESSGVETKEMRRRVIPDNEVNLLYGFWRTADVERFGYIVPESVEKERALARNAAPGGQMADAELKARQTCAQTPNVQRFADPTPKGAWVTELSSASTAVRATKEWDQALAEWRDCLSEVGVQVPAGALIPDGVNQQAIDRREVTESDVRIAVADVTCKKKVNLIQRLADLDAAAQASVIAEYRDEMFAARADLDRLLVAARQVLTAASL